MLPYEELSQFAHSAMQEYLHNKWVFRNEMNFRIAAINMYAVNQVYLTKFSNLISSSNRMNTLSWNLIPRITESHMRE